MTHIEDLQEALEFFGPGESYTGAEATVLIAARRWADLTIVCPTCEGSGTVVTVGFSIEGHGGAAGLPCPDCRGGRQLNPEKVERMARKDYDPDNEGYWERMSDQGRESRLKSAEARLLAALWGES